MQSQDIAGSQPRLLPHTNITSASFEGLNHGRTHSQIRKTKSGSPNPCSSVSPRAKAPVNYQEACTPKQLFQTTISSDQQKISNSRTQPSLEAAGKLAQDHGHGERATLISTGPSVSTGHQGGANNHSTATFQSNANSNSGLTTNQTRESLEQSLSARRGLKALPGTQSQQLKLMQPFHTNAVHQVASVFTNEQGQTSYRKPRSPRPGKQAPCGKKPSHMANTISSARRATHASNADMQAQRAQAGTPSGPASTRGGLQAAHETVVDAMLKRAYKRRLQKNGSVGNPAQASADSPREMADRAQPSGRSMEDDQPAAGSKQKNVQDARIKSKHGLGGALGSGTGSKHGARPEGTWVTPGKPEVDAEDEEEAEAGDYMLLERGRHETAEVAEDPGLPTTHTKSLTPMQTKLAQQAHAQQQRLFAQQQNENSSFGVQLQASESPSAVVLLDTCETPGNLAERTASYDGLAVDSSEPSTGPGKSARAFRRRAEPAQAQLVAEYDSEEDESDEGIGLGETPSDYIEVDVDASEFPYADTKKVQNAMESMSEESCSEDEESQEEVYVAGLDIPNPLHVESQDFYTQAGRPGESEKARKAIDESTPNSKLYSAGQLPKSENQAIESSRSCKPAATGPFPSAFSTKVDRPPGASGCKTPFEKQRPSPMHTYINKTVECASKKKAPTTKAKLKQFKLHQIPSLDLTHSALSPSKAGKSSLHEHALAKGTPKQRPMSNYQVTQQQQMRNKAISSYNKTTKTPIATTLYQTKNTYSNYLNEQTSVLAARREGEKQAQERIAGAEALRQKSTSATAKYERASRNPLGPDKQRQDLSIFVTAKPAQRGPGHMFQTSGVGPAKGQETPTLLTSSPSNAKRERQRPTGSASITSTQKQRKRDKRKHSLSQLANPISLQAQVIQSAAGTQANPPATKQKTESQAKQGKVNKTLMYELKAANSVRNHPAAPTNQGGSYATRAGKPRPTVIDPSMTQPCGALTQSHVSQLDAAWQSNAGEQKRSASKVKVGQAKVQKVKKNSLNSNQLLLTGLAQKVNAVAAANLKSDQHQIAQAKAADKQNTELVKKETGTGVLKQRQKHYSTSMVKGQNISSFQEMRINSQAVQISKFAKQSSLGGVGEASQITESSSAIPSTTHAAASSVVLKNTVNQQLRHDKKLGHATTVLSSHKNSILSTKNENHIPRGVNSHVLGTGARQAAKPYSGLLTSSLRPVKSTQGQKHPASGQRDAAGGKQERSSSVIKLSKNAKTEQTENSLLGATGYQRKSGATYAMNPKLQTPRNDLSEIAASAQPALSTINARAPHERKVRQDWGLLEAEKALYGDRCPKGYEKLRLLGKGGCAIVWLAKDHIAGKNVALKQFPKPRSGNAREGGATLDPTAKIEIEIGRRLFTENVNYNGYSIDPQQFPGIRRIAKLYDVLDETRDVWLAYEVGAKPLSDHLFDVKGEFYKGERIYGVQHQDFYKALRHDKTVLRDLIRMLAEVFDVLAMFRIVHADIKPDNILIDFDGQRVKDIKLIDFGSAFSYENPSNISASTPEYLAPEVLEYLENRAQNTQANGTNSTNLCRVQEPWSYDMWSLGAILLELLTGIPIWMSLKCRAQTHTGKSLVSMGIFGVQGRQGKKILQKQQANLKSLSSTLKKYDCYGLDKDPDFMDLLIKMLDPNPVARISPIEVLEHPFITGAD